VFGADHTNLAAQSQSNNSRESSRQETPIATHDSPVPPAVREETPDAIILAAADQISLRKLF
jgi:hypothetical protein